MSRRQSSQSSLSRYARASDAGELENRSMDFCNAFWGINDPGYEVLLARMRIAGKTVDDLRNFWKERAAIEDDYAKRLVRLSKQLLGQDEVGELKNSLDVVRQETERQAGQHLTLSITIRKELERSANDFAMKQAHHKKTFQLPIEKTFKQKQQNEHYVAKAKEHYEQECHRVNSYTAQKALVQGKELEKILIKLERAQSMVETNRRDYQNFTRALADTVARWDKEWKSFCDQCQDMEEERLEFMKDNIWAYANAVSTVCVNEDESCEAMRVALERLEVEKDIEYFIVHHGTGPAIPEPPPFINYAASEPTSLKPLTRAANFARSTTRPRSIMGSLTNANPPPEEEPVDAGTAGIGTQHMRGASQGMNTAQNTGMSAPQLPPQNTMSPVPSLPPIGSSAPNLGYHQTSASSSSMSGQGPYSMPTMAPTSGRRGSFQAPNLNLNQPADQGYGASSYKSTSNNQVGGPGDPIAGMLDILRENPTGDTISRRGGTLGRASGQNHQPPSSNQGSGYQNHQAASSVQGSSYQNHQPPSSMYGSSNRPISPGVSALSPPGGMVDYHAKAEAVVGAHPASRPPSPALNPAPPHAAHMQPNMMRAPSPIERVQAEYGQAFPGERRLSRNNSFNTESQQRGRPNDKDLPSRSNSPGGFAGVGAGRSPSPQPMRPGASPAPRSPQFNSPSLGPGRTTSPAMSHNKSLRRAASPAAGILFDPNGNVISDDMAERWKGNQQQQPVQQKSQQQVPIAAPQASNPYQASQWQSPYPGQQQQQAPITQQQQGPPPGTSSNHNSWTGFAPPPAPPPLNPATSPYPQYGQPQQQPVTSAPSTRGGYPPQSYQQPTTYQPQQPPLQPQQTQQTQGQRYPTPNAQTQAPQNQVPAPVQTTQYTPANSGYDMSGQGSNYMPQGIGNGPGPTQQDLSLMGSQPTQPSQGQGGPNGLSSSPMPPTGNFIEDRGILFYVKALYDYTATIEEEFDFQAGDVIAVLATPDDGWWQGILLDDSRRQPGRTVFPSNFVCLF